MRPHVIAILVTFLTACVPSYYDQVLTAEQATDALYRGSGSLENLQFLLDAGADPNTTGYQFGNALVRELGYPRNVANARLLVEYGADPNMEHKGHDALDHAIMDGDVDLARFLVEHGADVHAKSPSDRSAPLMGVALHGKNGGALVQLFVESGANPNCCKESIFGTPLFLALDKNHFEAADALVTAGASVMVEKRGATEFSGALYKGYHDLAHRLLDNTKGVPVGYPLHVAVENNSPTLVQALLDMGVSANQQNESGALPIHSIPKGGHSEVVALLLENGANVNARSPAHRSILSGTSGTRLAIRGGETPLHIAAAAGNLGIVEFLLRNGADRNARLPNGSVAILSAMQSVDTSGYSAQDIATIYGHSRVAAVLSSR